VAINYLKRYAADVERESGQRIQPYKAPASGRRIAVVGGGAEGLSTAFFAARLGHEVTVYEAGPQLGGLLRSAIAKERLPNEVLDWDIEGILDMGVKAETGKVLGEDFTVDKLLDDNFEAVFLAAGGWDSRLARGAVNDIESPVPGMYMMVDLLKLTGGTDILADRSNVVIYGGGKLALKAAGICRQAGAQAVTLMFREDLAESPITDADLKDADIDGLHIVYNAAIHRLRGAGDCLTHLEYVETKTQAADTLEAQVLIIAAGRFPELIFVRRTSTRDEGSPTPGQPLAWEAIPPYKPPALRDEVGLFSQGDVLADYSAAIKAIGAGRRAAASLQQIMYGIEPSLTENVITPHAMIQDVDHVEAVEASQRTIMPICSGRQLSTSTCGELEKGFSSEMAQAEASRCLQCGLICYEHTAPPQVKAEAAVQE
jgi:NADPH-dependent glutamate synthase beta subunit-like oxidoreductase